MSDADPALRVLEAIPPRDVPSSPEAFLQALGGPALMRIRGRDGARVRALSTLLHGNEPSGLRAVHGWLRAGERPAVDVLVLVASVRAALAHPAFSHRSLPGRPDLNRCFFPPFESREGRLAEEALARLRAARPEALVDLHNTTGHTPPYGVGPGRDRAHLDLVALFAPAYVHSDIHLGTLVEAADPDFPSVVIECGRAGDPASDAVAAAGLERYLRAERLGDERAAPPKIRLLERPLRVSLRPEVSVAYADGPRPGADLTVREEIDRHNFETLPAGSVIGWVRSGAPWPILATGASGEDESRDYFTLREGVLEARREITPIMMTTDPGIARSDCLFYVVHPAGRPG